MIKRMGYVYFVLILAMLQATGCSIMLPGGLTDSTAPVNQKGYRIMGRSEGSVSKASLFGLIPLGKADMEEAIQKAIEKRGGDELINVTWYHTYTNYYVVQVYTFTVRGTVIKYAEGAAEAALTRRPPEEMWPHKKPKPPYLHTVSVGLARMYEAKEEEEYHSSSAKGVTGFDFTWQMRRPSAKPYYFFPAVTFSYLSGDVKYSTDWYHYTQEEVRRSFSVSGNVGLDVNAMSWFKTPQGIRPYAETGVGYFSTGVRSEDTRSIWHLLQVGWNIGIGTEYRFHPKYALDIELNRQSVFWDSGLSSSSTFDLTYHYWKLNVGLVFQP